ncbi:MAG: serine hydrolase domain-containing protein [Nocardioidaceae bacterium]
MTERFDAGRLAVIDRALARFVDEGVLPGWQLVVGHAGEVVHAASHGYADREAGRGVGPDTLYAIHSLTKPVTAVAVMTLVEQGLVDLATPVRELIAAFADARVVRRGNAERAITAPAAEPVRLWHLLSHTAGLSYGYEVAELDRPGRAEPWETHVPEATLAEAADAIASAPLLYEPGTSWNYSRAFDVLGRVVEVVSGRPFDSYLRERVLEPLGMTDTHFVVPEADRDRVAPVYLAAAHEEGAGLCAVPVALTPPAFPSGGGGLTSTARDYHAFGRLFTGGGEVDGERVLAPATVAHMRRNHLPGGADIESLGGPHFANSYAGLGHGLGLGVVIDAVANGHVRHEGEVFWAGAAGATFWADRRTDVVVVFLANLVPHTTYPVDGRLRTLVNQALLG